jgi:hypothetical protein
MRLETLQLKTSLGVAIFLIGGVHLSFAQPLIVEINGGMAGVSICAGQSVTLTAVASGGIEPYTYLWSNSDTGPSITVFAGGVYEVTVTDDDSPPQSSPPASITVIVTIEPTATISYAGTPFCTSLGAPPPVTLTGTGAFMGGTYSASSAGLTIDPALGDITPSSSTPGTYTVTYTIPASGGCPDIPVTTSVTITEEPSASISYADTPFCSAVAGSQPVTLTGTGAYTGGTYSADAGLTINSSTGAITPSSSTPGTYTVTYTVGPSGGCAGFFVTTDVTITLNPTATISYAGTPFCTSLGAPPPVTLTGTGAFMGGTYSASSAGLTIDPALGDITPSSSTPGTYTVTYTIPASGGCPDIPVTTSVTITEEPSASISYADTPFCSAVAGSQPVTLTGTGAYTGGTYSADAGLTINSSTGAITPSSSTPGTYTVTYTVGPSGGCAGFFVTTDVTITLNPTATISYAGTPFCTSLGAPPPVTLTGTGAFMGGTYSASSAGLTIDPALGDITPSSSTPGTYTVTYTIPASGGCPDIPVTTSVMITEEPSASISYADTPFCSAVAGSQPVTLTGTGAYTGGTYSADAGLTINSSTGAITPSSSTPGTYTVTYTVGPSGGCAGFFVTTDVTITLNPTATISYAGTPFCTSLGAPPPVTLTGTGAFMGGTYSASSAGSDD